MLLVYPQISINLSLHNDNNIKDFIKDNIKDNIKTKINIKANFKDRLNNIFENNFKDKLKERNQVQKGEIARDAVMTFNFN